MRFWISFILCCLYLTSHGQSTGRLILKGTYSKSDSTQITGSYYRAHETVHHLLDVMTEIWQVEPDFNQSKKDLRNEAWLKEEAFVTWLGKPERIGMVRRKIKRIHSKFKHNLILIATREDRGKCNRWTGAWAIPFGKIRIRLCENFFNRPDLQEKIIVHELGHEAGILFHRNIHNCWVAKSTADSFKSMRAKRSTENYAWLAVSYLGKECTY